MRWKIGLASVVVLSVAALAVAMRHEHASPGKLIVHEWGTFTNFSGSDGVQLDFRPLVNNDLPPFVLDRARQAGVFNPLALFSKDLYLAKQRMETPVTYFYTDTPREVDVRVDFPRGLLTEFYPPVSQMEPPVGGQMEPLHSSYLRWSQIRLIPHGTKQSADEPVKLPEVPAGNPYAAVRETDSAAVRVSTPLGQHDEKFLFYRGIGNFTLPIELIARGAGHFKIHNRGSDPITGLLLVSIHDKHVRFAEAGSLAAVGELDLTEPSTTSSEDELAAATVKRLVAAGLYDKEAHAMVNTWRGSWFGEEGTRLLYIVPRRLTDTILPLAITPAPHQTVRVLVGRMEILTPEQELHVVERLKQGLDPRADDPQLAAEMKTLLGRFAEPALLRIGRTTTDPQVQRRAAELVSGQPPAK